MPAGEGSAFGAIPAKVHRTPSAFTGTRFIDEQPLTSRVGTEFDSTWIGPGEQINIPEEEPDRLAQELHAFFKATGR
jgi:hypothetical protein